MPPLHLPRAVAVQVCGVRPSNLQTEQQLTVLLSLLKHQALL
jgi:hypothetical protein